MTPSATVIDFARHRTRKQAQQRAREMWALYALHAGLYASQWVAAAQADRARQG